MLGLNPLKEIEYGDEALRIALSREDIDTVRVGKGIDIFLCILGIEEETELSYILDKAIHTLIQPIDLPIIKEIQPLIVDLEGKVVCIAELPLLIWPRLSLVIQLTQGLSQVSLVALK